MPPPRVYRHRGKPSKPTVRPAMEQHRRTSGRDSPQARAAGGRRLRGPPQDIRWTTLLPLEEGWGPSALLKRAVQEPSGPLHWTHDRLTNQPPAVSFYACGGI